MEIAEKIRLVFNDLDQERIVSVAATCIEMVTSLRLNLAFCKKDQHKLKIIQSKQKEAQEKLKEMATKSQYAMNLYHQHLDIEYNMAFNNQPFNLPETADETSIFKVELFRPTDSEDQYNGMDHMECALTNAQKVCQESILWTIFYSELEDMEQEVKEEISLDKQNKLAEDTSKKITVVKENTSYTRNCQRIFKDGRGREIFEYLQTNMVSQKNQLADYTFIFRRMQRDEFIYEDIKEKTFRDFISRHFDIEINSKLKPDGYNITDSKEKMYSNAVSASKAVSG